MANAALIARAAATVLTDENTRKTMGWIIVAVLSPIILVIAFVCALASGSATHNVSAAELCFYGGELPQDTPEEYRTYIEDMRTSFELLDGFITTANSKTEGEKSLDEIRVKAFFYALYFGEDSPSRRDHQKFVDCFVTYEERTRMVPVEGSDPPTEAEETYTVAIPIEDLETVWRNIAAAIPVRGPNRTVPPAGGFSGPSNLPPFLLDIRTPAPREDRIQIGRASCRERVSRW